MSRQHDNHEIETFSKEESEKMGAFLEDALSEADAFEAAKDNVMPQNEADPEAEDE